MRNFFTKFSKFTFSSLESNLEPVSKIGLFVALDVDRSSEFAFDYTCVWCSTSYVFRAGPHYILLNFYYI